MRGRPRFVGPLIHLRMVPAFGALSPVQFAALAQETEEVLVHRGTPLLEVGHHAEAMYFIVEGSATVHSEGKAVPVHPGGVVGFLEVLARTPVTGFARAESDVVALRLDAEALRDACESQFGILYSILADVAQRTTMSREALKKAMGGEGQGSASDSGLPMDRVGRILALHRSAAFPSAGMDALADLAGQITDRAFAAGDDLWTDEEGPEGAFLIRSGEVSVSSPRWSKPVRVGPGGVPGMVVTLADTPTDIRAVAKSRVVTLRVAKEPLLDLLEDHAEMAFAFLGRLARCLLVESVDRAQATPPTDQPG